MLRPASLPNTILHKPLSPSPPTLPIVPLILAMERMRKKTSSLHDHDMTSLLSSTTLLKQRLVDSVESSKNLKSVHALL